MTAILDILGRRQADWATLAKSDAGAAGTFARGFVTVRKGEAVYASVSQSPLRVDEKTMCSYGWRISTSDLDREGDTIIPKSPMKTLKNYKRNPVVSFDHFKFDPLPVGTSIGEGDSPLVIGPDYIEAGCKHHDQTKMARDVFALTKAGVLRSASIAFLPLKAKQVGDVRKGSLNSPRFQFDEIDVTEWAICSVPVNPEAVRMQLSRGTIESDELKKSLADFAEKPRTYEHGWTPEDTTMAKTVKIRDIQSVRLAKAHFADADAARAWAKSTGFDDSVLIDRPGCFEFTQHEGEHESSVKLAKGIEAMLLKAVFDTSATGTNDREVAVDETTEETPAPVQKAAAPEGKAGEGKPEPKGPPRVTNSCHSLADLKNHMAGCKQYLTESIGLLEHDPTVGLYKEYMANQDEWAKKFDDHAAQHFDGVDMNKLSQDHIAAKAEEEEANGKAKPKPKNKSAEHDEETLAKVAEVLGKRDKALADIEGTVTKAAEFQTKFKERIKVC